MRERNSFRAVTCAAFALGSALCGCAPSGSRSLGAGPEGTLTTVAAARSATETITLTGRMTEKCPVAACWFKLQDKTGVVTVDVKAAGFVVSDVPVGATVTAYGKMDSSGAEPVLHATGLRW
jgi:uncharacterized protein YdeI (BOF family)